MMMVMMTMIMIMIMILILMMQVVVDRKVSGDGQRLILRTALRDVLGTSAHDYLDHRARAHLRKWMSVRFFIFFIVGSLGSFSCFSTIGTDYP
jgi:hypothetical protein